MKINQVQKTQKNKPPKAFALIATITILALLSVIALAMLSLSSVEVKQTAQSKFMEKAQANARMAMMIAVGELQKHMGPDQRISTEAALFDTNIQTPEIDGVLHPHWVAVYSTLDPSGKSMITRNANRGGEHDKRTDTAGKLQGNWQHGKRHKEVITYLVSGNEGLTQKSGSANFQNAMTTQLTDKDSVELVKMNYPQGDKRRVRAKLVPVKANSSTNPDGQYAWWVRDLGVASKVNLIDPYAGKTADPSSPSNGGYYRLLTAADAPPKFIHNKLDTPPSELAKIIDIPELGINGKDAENAYKDHWFDITTYGYGVLANVRTGKLRRNLTDYLNKTSSNSNASIQPLKDAGNIVSPGIADTDYLIGTPNADTFNWTQQYNDSPSWAGVINKRAKSAPRFATLRKYARLADHIVFKNGQTNLVWPAIEPNIAGTGGYHTYDGYNLKGIKIKKPTGHSVAPILTEASLYFDVSSYPRTISYKKHYFLRTHYLPRFTLWNPYNVTLKMEKMSVWLQIPGQRRLKIKDTKGKSRIVTMNMGKFLGGAMEGSLFFTLEKTTFKPGECLVFSPKNTAKYDGNSLTNNVMSATVAPDPGRNFYLDGDKGGFRPTPEVTVDGKKYKAYDFPSKPKDWVQIGGNAAQDVRVVLKKFASNLGAFRSSPQLIAISGTPKVGGAQDVPLIWLAQNRVKMKTSTLTNGRLNKNPDPRTRESIRLRWLIEPRTNLSNCGLSGTNAENLFSSAYFANWNLRAGFLFKTPFSNTSPREPFFHGVYSRDIGGPESDWSLHTPPVIGGKARGNPFGPHQEALKQYVIYDIPRKETGIISLAQLQNAKISEYGWLAGSAIGNAFADPRMKRYHTVPVPAKNKSYSGWNGDYYGQSRHGYGSGNYDYIAKLARGMIQFVPDSEQVVYDLSHNVNRSLWDDYFLTSGNNNQLKNFIQNPSNNPLPNSRLHLLNIPEANPAVADYLDFHRAARWLLINGAFNVNSTSIPAWIALLSATRDSGMGDHPFPQVLNPPEGGFSASDDPFSKKGMAGFRNLTDDEIKTLAEKIVEQVKLRGPFLSLSDFVNRRLVDDKTGLMGALQAAINDTSINDSFTQGDYKIDTSKELPDYAINASDLIGIKDGTTLYNKLKPTSKFAGAPGYLTQADLLQTIGPVISARSDCFLIRAYGEV